LPVKKERMECLRRGPTGLSGVVIQELMGTRRLASEL